MTNVPPRIPLGASLWPNLFIVGAPRAGTTSLWHYLRQHPDIFMPLFKEPYFFAGVKPPFARVIEDERTYLRLFARGAGARLRGEASPWYLADPVAPTRIKQATMGAKIIIILREPVARAYSEYWHVIRFGADLPSFAETMEAAITRHQRGDTGRSIFRHGLYANDVRRYLSHFGDDVLILYQAHLMTDVRKEVARTFEFLGVDPAFAGSFRTEAKNTFALPRNSVAGRIYGSRRMRALGARLVPDSLQPRVERLLLARSPKPPLSERDRLSCEPFFADDEEQLLALLDSVPWARRHQKTRRP
jgi:sulfotransferase family protein